MDFKTADLFRRQKLKEIKILIFDTRTTGLPIRVNSQFPDFKEAKKWPFLLELSWIILD